MIMQGENQQTDPDPQPAIDDPETRPGDDPPEGADDFDLRRQRIDQFFHESLCQADAHTSIVGTVGADVMTIELQFAAALREALGTGRVSAEVLSQNQGGIEMLLKLSKNVAQFSQLQRKMLQNAAALAENGSEAKK